MQALLVILLTINYALVLTVTCVASNDLWSHDGQANHHLSRLERRHHVYFFYLGLLTTSTATLLGLCGVITSSFVMLVGYVIATWTLSMYHFTGTIMTNERRILQYKLYAHAMETIVVSPIVLAYALYIKKCRN
ncbi:hypothetical protein HDE_03980 [Halotydeus destructor]|nr:hypothetical protein HDE_03980 [Halotydeus destructor]